MRLGELLLKGSEMLFPLRGCFFDREAAGCAQGMIGAAAAGVSTMGEISEGYCRVSGPLRKYYTDPILPCGCDSRNSLMWGLGAWQTLALDERSFSTVLVHIFNQHVCATEKEVAAGVKKWSIKQLAAWLDEVEGVKPEPVKVEEEELVCA